MNRADESPDPLHGHDTYRKVSVCLGAILSRLHIFLKCTGISNQMSFVDGVADSGIEPRSVRSGSAGRGQEYEGEICTQIY